MWASPRVLTDRQGNLSMAGGSSGLGLRLVVVGDPRSEFVRTMVRLACECEVQAVQCHDVYSAVAEMGGLSGRRTLIVGTMRELTRENGRFFELAAADAIRCCCLLDARTTAGRDGVLAASRAGATVIGDLREAEDVLTEWLAGDGHRPERLAPQDLLDDDLRATEAELSALLGPQTDA